jgi:hypothetical protein
MHAIEIDEGKRFRGAGSTVNSVILLSVVVGLAAIGAQAPDGQYATLKCAFEGVPGDAVHAAAPQAPGTCGPTGTAEASAPAASDRPAMTARYGVPEASTALGPDAVAEPLPPTF